MEDIEEELVPDGGRQTTQFYWYNPSTGAALYHTAVNEDEADPFFNSVEDAESFLEQQAESSGDKERYEGLSLYKVRNRKEEDAVEVLMDQSGIQDFAPDGGMQIDNPSPDKVWFWYDPSVDAILQEEVEPYDIRGMFETKRDADRFLNWYSDQYGVNDASHMELYSAEIELEGYGPEQFAVATPDPEEPPEQIEFDEFHADAGGGDS